MANEIDRMFVPDIVQKSFSISLGAMLKTVDAIKHPARSLRNFTDEVKTLTTPPADSGRGIRPTAEALASVWISRGMSLVAECRVTGEKLTD